MILTTCLICVLILYYVYKRNYSYWDSKGVPVDKPCFIFGSCYNLATRKQHFFHVLREIYEKFDSPYVGIYIFHQPTLLIRSPKLIKKILVKDFDKFIDRKLGADKKVDPIAAYSLFAAESHIWKNLRAKLTPVFSSGKMKSMFPLMKSCGSDLVTYLEERNGEEIDLYLMVKKFAVDVIASCAFGINSNCLKNEDSEILEVSSKVIDTQSLVRSFTLFCFFFAPKLLKIFKLPVANQPSVNYLIELYKNTVKERQQNKIFRHDLIDLLNELKKNESIEDRYALDDLKMAAQAVMFFTAGNDTTTMTITFALFELALNTDFQDRLRLEIQESFKKYNGFTYEGLQEMKYLDMVLNEVLRKYPFGIFLSRKAATRYTFEETGLTLEKDDAVLIPIAGLHYDSKYFSNPERFDPERFNEKNKSKIVSYSFMPFGDGPRNCIGQRFGAVVSKVALAYCLKNFVFEKSEATSSCAEFDPHLMFLFNKTGFYLKVRKL